MKVKNFLFTAILLATIILAGCSTNEETETKVLTDEHTQEVKHLSSANEDLGKRSIPLQLSQEQKEKYYKGYKKIVEEANEAKIGIGLEVTPIADFKPEDWVEPKEYKRKIQEHIDSFLKSEHETLNALPSTTTKANMGINGETKKIAHLYVSDTLFSVEVMGKLETQYNDYRKGQVFLKVDNITSHIASSSHGEWEQTSNDASLIDDKETRSSS